MVNDLVQFALVLVLMSGLTVAMGKWLTRVFTREHHGVTERWTYAALGIDPSEKMSWKRYAMILLVSNAAMMMLGYLLLSIQGLLPFDSLQRAAQTPDLAFNTAASFVTNTNWQSYSGESSLSNFSQMAVITFLMMVSASTGVAACGGFIRGLSRKSAQDIGNYWVDFTRVLYRVLLPLSLVIALIYVWQGMPQTLNSEAVATTLEGLKQHILMGPVASLESIKHLGTNGGGFFSMNAAHPYENPTPLTNTLHILSMLLIPAALTYTAGSMLMRRRQGWAFFAAFLIMFIGSLAIVYSAEQQGNPNLAALGIDQHRSDASGGRQHGGQGTALRHRPDEPVRCGHDCRHHRLGERDARFADPDGRVRSARGNDAEQRVRR